MRRDGPPVGDEIMQYELYPIAIVKAARPDLSGQLGNSASGQMQFRKDLGRLSHLVIGQRTHPDTTWGSANTGRVLDATLEPVWISIRDRMDAYFGIVTMKQWLYGAVW